MLEDNSTDVIFYVHIFEENGQIVGEHCFDNGIVEDCLLGLKHSLYDVVVINDNTVKFTFETGFGAGANTASDFIGKVKLTKISQNKIRWEIIRKPSADYAVPTETILECSKK